ncbi:MAG: hypothetical protein KGL39_35470 [Patescibacteria group bacterium]|nr:hypothetical protein [Patescibacteria group bacterium]
MKGPIKLHKLTLAAKAILQALPRGEVITYEQLEEELGLDVRPGQPGYHYVKTARGILRRDGTGTFWPIDGKGIKHLTSQEVALVVTRCRTKRMRTQARFLIQEGKTVNLSDLNMKEQATLTACLANAGTVRHITDVHFTDAQTHHISKTLSVPQPVPPTIEG